MEDTNNKPLTDKERDELLLKLAKEVFVKQRKFNKELAIRLAIRNDELAEIIEKLESDEKETKEELLDIEQFEKDLKPVEDDEDDTAKELNEIAETKIQKQANAKSSKQSKFTKAISEIGYYIGIVAIVIIALFVKMNSSAPTVFLGYSGMIVLSESMQDVIEKGSLVITKQVDPQTLVVGDDISYMANETTSITHRIVGIRENYNDTGQRGFITQGTMNKEADSAIVPAVNVIGKVIYHSKPLGDVALFIENNWPIILFILLVLLVLATVLKRIFREDDLEKIGEKKNEKKERS